LIFVVVVFASVLCAFASSGDWALTPSGWRPVSCIYGPIPEEHVVVDGPTFSYLRHIQTGKLVSVIPPCKAIQSNSNSKPLPSGWAAYTWSHHDGGTLTSYNGTWSVPPTPADEGLQTLFLFTGFQNAYGTPANVTNIIQPVLQWGSSAAGGGKYWALASWYVDSNNNAFWSTLTQTQSGHNVQGNMYLQGSVWTIDSIDVQSSQKTSLQIATNTSEPFAFVTLEVYSVATCGEYPTGSDTFSNLVFSPQFTPSWTPVASQGCQESVTVGGPTSVTINF